MVNLRPYQQRVIADLRASYNKGNRKPCLVLPTGGGKTIVAASIIRSAVDKGGRVLFLAHRGELLSQTVAKLDLAGVHDVRMIRADVDIGPPEAAVTVGSVQTLTGRLDNLPDASLIVCDEAHHFVAETFSRILERYEGARVLGMTATPERADGAPLGDIFDDLVVGSTVKELTTLGHLVPCAVWAPAQRLGRREIAMRPVDAYLTRAEGAGRAVVFCPTVAVARDIVEDFRDQGIAAACVHGNMSATERAETLARFRRGDVRVVVNVHVLTEGWDDPGAEVCILARKPGHAGTYLQMVGRVLRPSPGKTSALLLDLGGVSLVHGLPDDDRTYSLDGKAITSDRLEIRQCAQCGAVFKGVACPTCGQSSASTSGPEPFGIAGVDLVEVKQRTPPTHEIRIAAKWPGKCADCGCRFGAGTPIYWLHGRRGQRHAECPTAATVAA